MRQFIWMTPSKNCLKQVNLFIIKNKKIKQEKFSKKWKRSNYHLPINNSSTGIAATQWYFLVRKWQKKNNLLGN